ncbi:MAG: hypothetical protein P4L61_00855 [Candidatus Pacebacteria bacterium]|nr:hypothetical protein [Candidatus Paceibacterota bacterium]
MLNFVMKGLLKSKLKGAGVPEDEMERFLAVIEENPDFFKTMATKVQEKVAGGMSQEDAVKSIMGGEGAEMAKLFANNKK